MVYKSVPMKTFITGGVQKCTGLSKMLITDGVQECTYEDIYHRWCTKVYRSIKDAYHRWCTRVYLWRHLSQVVYKSVPTNMLFVGSVQECAGLWRCLSQVVYRSVQVYEDVYHRWCTGVCRSMEMFITGGVQCAGLWRCLSQVVYKGVPMKTINVAGVQECSYEDTQCRWCTRMYLWRQLS